MVPTSFLGARSFLSRVSRLYFLRRIITGNTVRIPSSLYQKVLVTCYVTVIKCTGNFILHYIRITFQCEFLVLLYLSEYFYRTSKIIFSDKASFGQQGRRNEFQSGWVMEHWKVLTAKKNFWILDALEQLK